MTTIAKTSYLQPRINFFELNNSFKGKFQVAKEALECTLDWAAFVRVKLPALPAVATMLDHAFGVSRVIDVVKLTTETAPQAAQAFLKDPNQKTGRVLASTLGELTAKVCRTVKKFLPLIVAVGKKVIVKLTLIATIAALIKGALDLWSDVEKLLQKVTLTAALNFLTDFCDELLTAAGIFFLVTTSVPGLIIETILVLGLIALKYHKEEKEAPPLILVNGA